MNNAKGGSSQTVRSFLSPRRPPFWECPDPAFMTSRSLPQPRRWLFGTGSTRSIPAGHSTGVAALPPFSSGTDSLWDECASRPPCGRWESRESIPGPTSARGLWSTRSIPTFLGDRHHLYPIAPGMDVPRGHHRLAFPVCRLLGAQSDLGDAVRPGRGGSGLFDRFSGHFQQRPGIAFHQRPLSRPSPVPKHPGQHGRKRASDRQHLHGTDLEKSQVRRGLSQRIRDSSTGQRQNQGLGYLLQHKKPHQSLGYQTPWEVLSEGGKPESLRN